MKVYRLNVSRNYNVDSEALDSLAEWFGSLAAAKKRRSEIRSLRRREIAAYQIEFERYNADRSRGYPQEVHQGGDLSIDRVTLRANPSRQLVLNALNRQNLEAESTEVLKAIPPMDWRKVRKVRRDL